jgi:hypothetical protein
MKKKRNTVNSIISTFVSQKLVESRENFREERLCAKSITKSPKKVRIFPSGINDAVNKKNVPR